MHKLAVLILSLGLFTGVIAAPMPELMRPITNVVIHHTAGEEKSVNQIRQGHLKRNFKDIAYHYVVFPNGKIETGRDIEKLGAGVWGYNKGYVQIVLVGAMHKHPPTQAQYLSATQLAAKWCVSYNLPYWRVRGHNEVALKNHGTLCPAINMKQFRIQVTKEIQVLK